MLQPPDTANVSPYVPPVDPLAPLRTALRGHYDIEREIGQGAFATVYLARDLKHERKVALKVLNADPTSDTGELRFIREIRMLARLQHPNILPLHDSGHVEALLYYVMPYVSGDTVRDRIDREKQMPIDAACGIARGVADALAYAHAQGIIHRDIKPENILLSTGHPILADFGIARAIDLAGVRQLTKTGAASPGTPAYMSPEQLMGDKELDGRSDTYSLGCVLFEMVTGKPPFAGKEGFVKRFTEPPPKASTLRKDLPAWVDRAIEGALQRNPQDRYATAKEFIAALCEPALARNESRSPRAVESRSGHSNAVLPGREGYTRRLRPAAWLDKVRSRPKAFAAIGVALVATAIALTGGPRPSRLREVFASPPLDSTKFAVLPPMRRADYAGPVADRLADRMYEALRGWNGLKLVTDLEVEDALRKRGHPPASLTEALAVSRNLGAGRMVWGRVVGGPTSEKVRAEVYDVAKNASTGRIALIDTAASADELARAMMTLISVPNRPRMAEGGDGLTRSYPAWTAYNMGHVALASWDIPSAMRRFEEATVADPDFPVAHLWLAQLRAWQAPGRPAEWRNHASRAASASARLTEHDALIARGLVDLARKEYPATCSSYAKLTAADSLDFVGWYGLGECQALDSLVTRSASSSSGWNFRSSNRSAAAAYMRALELQPRAHAILSFDRLRGLLPTAASKPRGGHSSGPRQEFFAASPSLMGAGETLAFIPYPQAKFAALPPEAISSLDAALEQNTERLYQFARAWTSQAPNDAAAFEALADVLDTRGEVLGDGRGRLSALGAISRARALTAEPGQGLRTATKEVWIRFKRGEFAAARTLADSLLDTQKDPSEVDARLLIGLAAVTGKISRTRDLARLTGWYNGGSNSTVPEGVSYPAAQLFAFAAFGVCDPPTLQQLRRQLDDALDRYVRPSEVAALRESLLARPRSMMSPCTAGQSALEIRSPHALLVRMQQAFARRNASTLRALLDSLSELAKLQRPGDLSADYIYQQAWLRAATGDTLAAIRLLDRTLEGLPAVSTTSLQEPGAAAGIIQAMTLRADLAVAAGDSRTATRWASGVATMWATGDPPLKPLTTRMLALAARKKT